MENLISQLVDYWQYPFVWYALIVGSFIALASSLLGVTLVLKRLSFIGDGLSHVAFGTIGIASVLSVSNSMLVVLPVTVFCAILLVKGGQNMKIKGDAMIAMLSVGALAIGYLVMNVFGTSSNLSGDVCSTLFGSISILTLSPMEVVLSISLASIVILIFALFYHKIFAITFDESFAKASGIPVERYNLIVATAIAIIIVVAMNLVGALLITALIVFPALSAMRLFGSFRNVILFSAVVGVLSAAVGILIAILGGTPVGSTIVAFNIFVFGLSSVIGIMRRKR